MANDSDFAALLERIAALEKRLDDQKGIDVPGSTLFDAGRVPYAAADGTLTSAADFTFDAVNRILRAAISLQAFGVTSDYKSVFFASNNILRWIVRVRPDDITGPSNFEIVRRDAGGGFVDAPITIDWSTGRVNIERGENIVAPTFQNSWANYGNGFAPVGYYLDPIGVVRLRGMAGAGANTTTMFTLPVGYRPAARRLFATMANNVLARVDITTGGEVVVVNGYTANTWVSLDGISFRAGT